MTGKIFSQWKYRRIYKTIWQMYLTWEWILNLESTLIPNTTTVSNTGRHLPSRITFPLLLLLGCKQKEPNIFQNWVWDHDYLTFLLLLIFSTASAKPWGGMSKLTESHQHRSVKNRISFLSRDHKYTTGTGWVQGKSLRDPYVSMKYIITISIHLGHLWSNV